MMDTRETEYGEFRIGEREALFRASADLIHEACERPRHVAIGLTGGSTPKAFYEWAVSENALDAEKCANAVWSVSDERLVPLGSSESNFGNAARLLLDPLGIPAKRRMPWPVQVDAHSASVIFNRRWNEKFGAETGFDLCFLGMGTDGHTASLFPNSAILGNHLTENFSCVDVPGKGWRLSITENGLRRCRRIVITVTGSDKSETLKRVLEEPQGTFPVQCVRDFSAKVIWLLDPEAAKGI